MYDKRTIIYIPKINLKIISHKFTKSETYWCRKAKAVRFIFNEISHKTLEKSETIETQWIQA